MLRLLDAADARTIVEIGSARGATTEALLQWATSHDATVHAVDPAPNFDTAELADRFPGRFVFHPAISFDAIPQLPPLDAVCLDGDHNWYTVINELRMLDKHAGARPMPLILMHDVGWPYGRRDQYYGPERIPEEFRKEWTSTAGLVPNQARANEGRGYNLGVKHAVMEGGPRNGVLTAAEDFVAESARPLRLVTVAGFAGLGVIIDDAAGNAALAREFDRLSSPEFLREQCALLETTVNRLMARRANDAREAKAAQKR